MNLTKLTNKLIILKIQKLFPNLLKIIKCQITGHNKPLQIEVIINFRTQIFNKCKNIILIKYSYKFIQIFQFKNYLIFI
jgi:hypothetical protein